jgi:hypothetical protein
VMTCAEWRRRFPNSVQGSPGSSAAEWCTNVEFADSSGDRIDAPSCCCSVSTLVGTWPSVRSAEDGDSGSDTSLSSTSLRAIRVRLPSSFAYTVLTYRLIMVAPPLMKPQPGTGPHKIDPTT